MKTFEYIEKRIYVVVLEYDARMKTGREVFNAFVERFPEYKDAKYDTEFHCESKDLVKIYFESCFDFVEK